MSDAENETPPPMDNGFEAEAEAEPEAEMEPVVLGENEDVTSALFGGGNRNNVDNDNNVEDDMANLNIQREEPETIKAWREQNALHLAQKDEKESAQKEELRAKAKKELDDWYKKYEETLAKTKSGNREADKSHIVAEMDKPIEPGTEWERVNKLCDFNAKNNRNSKDMSRMRSIMLQLKQQNN